ncbi:MAG TPA: ABA4-like family protein [Vicinamibacterales bacterium]|nr:ABA4-like family protein [Vicinamibacterales bacterium]
MSPDQIFSIVNFAALCCWLLLAVLPGRRWVSSVVAGVAVPGALAAIYTVVIAANFAGADGGFSSLPEVALLFNNSWLLLAGWIHYLAFDLLIGSWEARDSRERGIPHWLLLPCLILTFLFGPAGWLLYLGVRSRFSA